MEGLPKSYSTTHLALTYFYTIPANASVYNPFRIEPKRFAVLGKFVARHPISDFNLKKLLSLLAGLRMVSEYRSEPHISTLADELGLFRSARFLAVSKRELLRLTALLKRLRSAKGRALEELVGDEAVVGLMRLHPSDARSIAEDYVVSKALGHPECCIRHALAMRRKKGTAEDAMDYVVANKPFPFIPWRAHSAGCEKSREFNARLAASVRKFSQELYERELRRHAEEMAALAPS